MRDYARFSPNFWVKGSGKQLRGNPSGQLVAVYLATCQSATMIGIYYVGIPTICHETGLSETDVVGGLAACEAAHFAYYDASAELAWVPNMARYQVGESLSVRDEAKRKWVVNVVSNFRGHRFYDQFLEMYDARYGLSLRPPRGPHEAPTWGPQAPDQAPSGGSCVIARASDSASASVTVTDSERGHWHTVGLRDELTPELRAAAQIETVQDVDSCWTKFCGVYAGQHVHVAGRWQAWCVSWRNRERSERERNRAKEPPRSPAKRVVDVQAMLAQEAEERRRG